MSSSLAPSPCGGTAIRMRTGNRRSASPIISFELATIDVPLLFRAQDVMQRWRLSSRTAGVPARDAAESAALPLRSRPRHRAWRQALAMARHLARSGEPQLVLMGHDVAQ